MARKVRGKKRALSAKTKKPRFDFRGSTFNITQSLQDTDKPIGTAEKKEM